MSFRFHSNNTLAEHEAHACMDKVNQVGGQLHYVRDIKMVLNSDTHEAIDVQGGLLINNMEVTVDKESFCGEGTYFSKEDKQCVAKKDCNIQ